MHSRIFEIQDTNFERDAWASEETIADENYHIEGVDYFGQFDDDDERCKHIENFFGEYFPGKSFEIVKNEPGETAIVKFVGDIKDLYRQWMEQIKSAAEELNEENMNDLGIFKVERACTEPFQLCSKFYQEGWNGCTSSACDFFSYLRYLDKKNDGEPFLLYIGQVFDYHF